MAVDKTLQDHIEHWKERKMEGKENERKMGRKLTMDEPNLT